MQVFFDYERPELAAVLKPSFRATQIYKAVYQRWLDDFGQMTDVAKDERQSLATEWDIKLPAVHRRFDSTDGTRRYLVRLSDGELDKILKEPKPSVYDLLHGIIQHDLYHAGQIAVLKKGAK